MELSNINTMEVENLPEDIGSFDNMEIGQELIVPVGKTDEGELVFYGCLDFIGNSNQLDYDAWVRFTKDFTGYEPIGRCILKRTKDINGIYILAKASYSTGGCNCIAVYNSIFDFLTYFNKEGDFTNYKEIKTELTDIVIHKDIHKALAFCDKIFTHSFFTGLIYGAFEYVSGYRATKEGYATNEI